MPTVAFVWFAVAVVAALSWPAAAAAPAAKPAAPLLILVSFDGMRADDPDRCDTPTLDALAARGVRAEALVPVFPTLTFPNHYTIVTGLYPEHHGVVANEMLDPATGKRFEIRDPTSLDDPTWWGGEPLWVTAEKQGVRTATVFWVGSSAEIAGQRPTHWLRYDGSMPNEERVDRLLGFLDLAEDERPRFLTLYLSEVDSAGHRYGPRSDEVRRAVGNVDRALARLVGGLAARGLAETANLLVVSDHGMTEVSAERTVRADRLVSDDDAELVGTGAIVGVFPRAGVDPAALRAKIAARAGPHVRVMAKDELAGRLHYRAHPRIAPILLLADEGWMLTTSTLFLLRGAHGYDNSLPSMRGILVASGPAFARSRRVGPVENIHLYELMAHVLGLRAAPNDGSLDAVTPLLEAPPRKPGTGADLRR